MDNIEKKKLGGVIAGWIQRHRKVLLIVSIVILLVLLVIGIISAIGSSKNKNANILLVDFENLYFEWSSVEDAEKEAKAQELAAMFDQIEKNYAATYAHQRALFLMGDYYYYTEDWAKSADHYRELNTLYDKSYLAPIALYNAAAAMEEDGKSPEAAVLYGELTRNYPESPLAPRSLFAEGRVTEASDNNKAVEIYNGLIEQYPTSSWTKLARNRIIELKSGE